jgi:hypothetical protein
MVSMFINLGPTKQNIDVALQLKKRENEMVS